MGRTTCRRSTDREKTPQRKRLRKRVVQIHSKILLAKRKLDNVAKGDKSKVGPGKQSRAKICNRLLPEPAAGIYRNGIKGKDAQRAKTPENTFHKARLTADALKLFSGDTHEFKRVKEISTNNETPKQSSNNNSAEWMLSLQNSPVLGKTQSSNQKPYFVKKKDEKNFFEVDSNKIKKHNANDKSRHTKKLFQNDTEQLKTITSMRIFGNADVITENKTNEKSTELACSKNSKIPFCDPLSRYMEFCKMSAQNFEADILSTSDPVTVTLKRLRHVYADSFRRQLLRNKNKQKLENVESPYFEEHQACTFSDTSPVEFEVPKCSENHTVADRFQGGVSQKDKFHLIQNAKLKKSDGITNYNCTSYSLRNSFATNGTLNNSVVENSKNSDQSSKQSKDIRQRSKLTRFYLLNERVKSQLDSQKNSNVSQSLNNKVHDINNFSIDIPDYGDSRRIDNSKHLETSMFLNDSKPLKRYFSKNYSREKLPIAASDNVPKKCNDKTTNKCNAKNVKRVPTIYRRSSDGSINKPNSVQINGDYAEGLYKKCETNLFSRSQSNDIEKESCETTFPNLLKNRPTSIIKNAIFDQIILEPQIGAIKIKDSQESQVEQFDINMLPKERNEKNIFYRYDDSLFPRSFEASHNTNVYTAKLPQQEEISPDIRKHSFRSNNYRPINDLQGVSFSNCNIESTKQFPQQTKLHVFETEKQELFGKNIRDQNQNILFNNVDDRAIPTTILHFPQNIQTERRSTESCRENRFGKTDVEYGKNQINQNACHCNEHVYFDSANCPRKYKEQAHYFHKETAQPESLCGTRGYNSNVDICVNLPSSTTRKVPLLSLNQNNNQSPKAIDSQHRAVLLQNVTQPVKYLAVKNDSDIQRIPVYISDRGVRVVENIPLKVTLIEPNIQTKDTFPQEIATQVVSLQTDGLPFNGFTTRKISDQSCVERLNSVNAILFNPNSQSDIWYTSNL